MSGHRALGLNISEAAEYLGVAQNTVRTWADEGHIKHRRTPGGQRRFRKADLDKFLNDLDDKAEDNEQ
jgi:excisionase family DNA binding protein